MGKESSGARGLRNLIQLMFFSSNCVFFFHLLMFLDGPSLSAIFSFFSTYHQVLQIQKPLYTLLKSYQRCQFVDESNILLIFFLSGFCHSGLIVFNLKYNTFNLYFLAHYNSHLWVGILVQWYFLISQTIHEMSSSADQPFRP